MDRCRRSVRPCKWVDQRLADTAAHRHGIPLPDGTHLSSHGWSVHLDRAAPPDAARCRPSSWSLLALRYVCSADEPNLPAWLVHVAVLILITVIDVEHRLILFVVVLPARLFALAVALIRRRTLS